MKKLLLTASLMLMGVGLVFSDQYNHPSANTIQPASIGYGGVKYATGSFTVSIVTVTSESGSVLHGVYFSSGTCGTDFVDVFDSSSIATVTQLVAADGNNASLGQSTRFRIYNISGSTGSSVAGSGGHSCYGVSGPAYPIRINKGMWFRPNAQYNSLNLLYWKQD